MDRRNRAIGCVCTVEKMERWFSSFFILILLEMNQLCHKYLHSVYLCNYVKLFKFFNFLIRHVVENRSTISFFFRNLSCYINFASRFVDKFQRENAKSFRSIEKRFD